MRQERPQLIGRHTAVSHHLEARWALWNRAGGIFADYMTIGAPLPRDLRPLYRICVGGKNGEPGGHRQDEQRISWFLPHEAGCGAQLATRGSRAAASCLAAP